MLNYRRVCPAFGQWGHKYHMVGCIFPVYIPITRPIYLHIPIKLIEPQCLLLPSCSISSITIKPWSKIPENIPSNWMISPSSTLWQTNITMENHHFLWVNQLFLRPFSIAFCMFTRPGIPQAHWMIVATFSQDDIIQDPSKLLELSEVMLVFEPSTFEPEEFFKGSGQGQEPRKLGGKKSVEYKVVPHS